MHNLWPSQGFWGTGVRPFISWEQGNKSLKLKGTGDQRPFGGTWNIENQDFDFGEQGKMPIFFQGNKGPGTSPGRASNLLPLLLWGK